MCEFRVAKSSRGYYKLVGLLIGKWGRWKGLKSERLVQPLVQGGPPHLHTAIFRRVGMILYFMAKETYLGPYSLVTKVEIWASGLWL